MLHENKTYIITGGSRGIGAGVAKLLASEGAKIILTYSSRKEAAEKVLSQLSGSGHSCYQLDISSEESVTNAFKDILSDHKVIDGLVNNAGITADQIILRMKSEDFDRVIQTNLMGTFYCTKAIVKPMLKAKNGSIVNITSVIGQTGNAGQSNYAASKAGVEAFSKSIAQEISSRNIRLNCVAPGFIQTEMTDILTDAQKESIFEKIPMKRLGDVDDIGNAVSFLLSDKSKYITGHTVSVNGGLFMQ